MSHSRALSKSHPYIGNQLATTLSSESSLGLGGDVRLRCSTSGGHQVAGRQRHNGSFVDRALFARGGTKPTHLAAKLLH